MGAEEVAFSGGEPLLVPFIEEAVEVAYNVGLHVTIYSSGNSPNATQIIRKLGEIGLARLIFSMHGASSESYESITRVPGSFAALLKAMETAADAGLKVEIHFVPMSINYLELTSVVAVSQRFGASCTSVLRFVPHGRGKDEVSNRLSLPQTVGLREAISQLRAAGYTVRTGSPYSFMGLNERPTCAAGRDRLVVRPDLAIVPCDAFKNLNALEMVGTDEFSRLDKWSLSECWRYSPYLKLLRMLKREDPSGPCGECAMLAKCGAGCPAQKYLAFGKFNGVRDPECLLGVANR